MNSANLIPFLKQIHFFTLCDEKVLSDLERDSEWLTVHAGELIFSQGDEGDKCYIVYSGKVRIVLKNENGEEINLGIREKGDHFGETAIITDSPRNAGARAIENSVLLVIGKSPFKKYLLSQPDQRKYFEQFILSTSIHRFIRLFTDFSAISPKEIRDLVLHFEPEFFRQGTAVFRQGDEGDKLYLIERGKVKVSKWENGEEHIVNFLTDGDFFGEKALFEKTVRAADIVCLTDCHFFSLNKEHFELLLHQSPKLKKIIDDRIRSYNQAPPIDYQERIKRELSNLQEPPVARFSSSEGSAAATNSSTGHYKKRRSFFSRTFHFPALLQPEQSSCGTTCLMMVARFYGKRFSSSRLRELANVDRNGTSLSHLASAAEQVGFITEAVQLDFAALQSASLPCIAHWQGNHYVVVYRIRSRHVWVADPAKGLCKLTKDEFCRNWQGITLLLQPTPELEAVSEDTSSIRRFLHFVTPYKTILFEVFLASLLLNLLGLSFPVFIQVVIDRILVHQNVSMLNILFFAMLVIILIRFLLRYLRGYLILHISTKMDLRILVAFYRHLLALPLGFFQVRKIGDFTQRFNESVTIRQFLSSTALALVLDSLMIVAYLSLMGYYSVSMTGLTLLILPLFFGLTLFFTPILKRLHIEAFAVRSESESHLIQSIVGIETVKGMNIELPVRWEWEEKFIRSLNTDFKLTRTTILFESSGELVGLLSSTLLLWYGSFQVMNQAISIGELMAFMTLLGSVTAPITKMIGLWDGVQQVMVAIERLGDVFSARTEHPVRMQDSQGLILREPRGEIRFENVFFRYGGRDDPSILSNINLHVYPGQTVGIVGRSGSGKTTLVKLIPRLFDVTEGKITLDGCDLRSLNLDCLRRSIGCIFPNSFMLDDTIRQNISMYDPEETSPKIIEAAALAHAHDFITGLPMGYETRIGESGLQLSEGQKQRIAIARVLYRKPKILVFDEATNTLDVETERVLQSHMSQILSDKTAFIIAHKLNTIKNADTILVLDNGEIIEQGSHSDLMDKGGLYRYLIQQQYSLM